MTTPRKRGLVLGVLLASCAALPTTAQAQATAPTLTTTTSCIDPSVNQSVDVAASGLMPGASYFPLLELTAGDGAVELGYGPGNIVADAAGTGSSTVPFDSTTYTQNAAAGDGSSVWVKLRLDDWTLSAELRIPLCGADATPPAFAAAADRTVEATGPDGATVTYDVPAATDDVDGAVAATCTPASGTTFALGRTPVTCSATDAAGNKGTTSFTVTVADTTGPRITLPADIAADATSASGATATFVASATDAVDGTVPVTCDHASGETFTVGTTTVGCSATDAAGNTATGGFTVTVRPQPQAQPEPTDLKGLLARFGLDPRAAKNACNAITAVQNQIRARTGHGLTRAQADRLLATSRLIGALLHCR